MTDARKWWLLLGGIVVFLVTFHLLEGLIRPRRSEQGSTPVDTPRSPAPPELRRADDGAIEIRHDFFRRTTIRVGSEEQDEAVFDCLARGFEETFGNGTQGWTRGRVSRETERIQSGCLGSALEIPSLGEPHGPR